MEQRYKTRGKGIWLVPAGLFWIILLCGFTVFAAEVTYLKKPVQIKRQGQGEWKVLNLGDQVKVKDIIRTGMDARVEISLGKKRAFRIGQASEVELPELSEDKEDLKTRVKLILGRLWGGLLTPLRKSEKEKFEVQTETAVLGVKGTQFGVEYDKESQASTLSVISGTVAAEPPKSAQAPVEVAGPREIAPPQEVSRGEWMLLVSRDQKVVIIPGEPPRVEPLTDEDKADEWIQFNLERDRAMASRS